MKIVFFTHYTELYGANRSLLNLIEGLLLNKELEIVLIAPSEGRIMDKGRELNIECRIIPFLNETKFSNNYSPVFGFFRKWSKLLYNWSLVLRYAKSLKSGKGLILHSNSSATMIGAYFSFWLRTPHVWHIREFGWEDYKMEYDFGNNYFNYWLRKASAVISISNAIYNSRIGQSGIKKSWVIYNGVVFEEELQRRRSAMRSFGDPGEKKDIVFAIIGTISPEKNQEDAIRAFGLLCRVYGSARLLIVGTGEANYISFLNGMISSYDLDDKVDFLGFVDDMDEIYNKLDLLLMCSKSEALGRVTIEAMSYGVPVIGYRNGGTIEIIRDGFNGLLYSDGPVELSGHMKWMIDNRHQIPQMRENCVKSVREQFTIENYSKKVFDLYTEIWKRKG